VRSVLAATAAVVLTLLAGCGTTEAHPEPPLTTTVFAPGPIPTSPAATPGTVWVMPSLVGLSLVDAQAAVHALSGRKASEPVSHDVTGARRALLAGDSWRVCDQSIPAGAEFTAVTTIDLGVVKNGEECTDRVD
jgi:hypothetical protein